MLYTQGNYLININCGHHIGKVGPSWPKPDKIGQSWTKSDVIGDLSRTSCYYVLHPGDFVHCTKYLEEALHHLLEGQLDLQQVK